MSIIRITRDLIEKVTLTTHPKTHFLSSSQESVNDEPVESSGILSTTGTMGQASLVARTNSVVKGTRIFDTESSLFDEDHSSLLINLHAAQELSGTTTDIQSYLGHATPGSHISTDDGNCASADITFIATPLNGHTVVIASASMTDTYTFDTSRVPTDSTHALVGISGVTTLTGFAKSLRISIMSASLRNDIQITAAPPAGAVLTVHQMVKGTGGNGKTITGTALSAGKISVTEFSGGTSKLSDDDPTNPGHLGYLKGVRELDVPAKSKKVFGIDRFRPPWLFQNDHEDFDLQTQPAGSLKANRRMIKNQVRNVLLPAYRSQFTHPNYAYTNYHTLNFFTSSINWVSTDGSRTEATSVPYKWMNSKVLIYEQLTGSVDSLEGEYDKDRTVHRYNGKYVPETGFTFDFYINPRYTNDVDKSPRNGEFRAGTIMHVSGAYAVSLVSGSSRAPDGSVDGYRIMLQLSQSAEHPPSKWHIVHGHDRPVFASSSVNYKKTPYDLAWVSPDNSLKRNHWHHVAIRWGGDDVNNSTGSFLIDGKKVSEFALPGSSSIRPYVNQDKAGASLLLPLSERIERVGGPRFLAGRADPNALFIGNFYEGKNEGGGEAASSTSIDRFFNRAARKAEGFTLNLTGTAPSPTMQKYDPVATFNHPLNAEVHDLKIYNKFRTDSQIYTSSIQGPDTLKDLLFYVPPFYINENRKRNFLSSAGITSSRRERIVDSGGASYPDGVDEPFHYPADVFTQPFTSFPFNAGMSMNIDTTDINVENYCKDIVTNTYPRLLFLTSSMNSTRVEATTGVKDMCLTASNFMFDNFCTGSIKARANFILPCDNGKFQPNYKHVHTGSTDISTGSEAYLYRDDIGNFDPSLINLSNVFVTPPTYITTKIDDDGRLIDTIAQFSSSIGTFGDYGEEIDVFAYPTPPYPFMPTALNTANNHFLVYQASRDPSSNEIVLFNIPNLFYGNRIEPGTFTLTDSNVTGSRGKVSITLKDDGFGTLYRADSATEHAMSNGVGNIFYDEGLVLIKSPHLKFFGKDQFEVSFTGEQNIHVMKINVPCRPGMINSSSNPGFRVLSASLNANDEDSKFVYITGIYFHDDNMNVIMKANLAQPVIKRDGDNLLFSPKLDF